ncbi:hypothetical protein EO98_12430 [Methanosarcina sp. 2.H.T.1A.6]|uniref:hypothetical protein n=1 Tax=unclassified Methanosarcina TaxID=2644672 RepID=UPI00062259EA|nr:MULTISPECIES: hypothetical protein [unclassified Methanosarcina]KKG16206.1 hypothetical protein EO94_08995 [Methanosarcina sp. 2.H.T.1A.3]KKG23074.1 hypothetical protein EO98_12430 [Methanosarcina sp. 2.H.T.1A.6]KKG26297.1 hypothetical protein EO96_04915 [Methanosarcina sp. 2.H.T.1A.8]KKG27037.1 hypothetical protein EO97_06445 [Methanosarcina sp. 2.H.T.1A.15]
MFKKSNIVKWLMLTLFIYILLSGSASADDSELNDSESNEISDSITEFANDLSFIAYRGTIPETIDREWENSIADCWLNLNKIGPSYSEFDKSIKSVAASDVIIIELGSAYKGEVDNSRIDAMYQKIENYCEEQEGISDIPVVFMWAQDEEDLPLPDYGPQVFEEVKNEPGFIATRGIMPVITDPSEKVEWTETAGKCIHSFSGDLRPYMKSSGGQLTGFGHNYRGYIFVCFDPESIESVNDSIIDEIYLIIEEHSEQKGVNDVPVVFEWRGESIEDIAVVDGPYPDEADDSNLSGNEEEITGNETTNQMPGFTFIMLVLCLLFLVKSRK